MASSMTKISSATLTSNGNITFTGIPQTYTDLMVKISGADSSGNQTLFVLINGDTGSNYAQRMLRGYASANTIVQASSPRANIYTYSIGDIPTIGANYFNSGEIYLANYTTSSYKTYYITSTESSNTASLNDSTLLTGLWSSSAAITSLTFYSPGTSLATGTTITLYGIAKYAETGTGSKAIGGTVTTAGGYTYHTFLSSGMFTPTTAITGAEVLVVAGGGGSGVNACGGGGAGGLVYASAQSYSSGVGYAAIIGAGGKASASGNGSNGTSSVFASGTVAVGGGGGGYPASGNVGGSGGGSHRNNTAAAGTAGQGYAGGIGTASGGSNTGGGGGAGGVGGNVTLTNRLSGGNGGIGSSTYSAWGSATGTGQINLGTYYYAGGGGGYAATGSYGGFGGGGGNGGIESGPGSNGWANTGGGGGGSSANNSQYGSGGSGIIIVRYTT